MTAARVPFAARAAPIVAGVSLLAHDPFAATFGSGRGLPGALRAQRPRCTVAPYEIAHLAARAVATINALGTPGRGGLGDPEARGRMLDELLASALSSPDTHWMDWLAQARERADPGGEDPGLDVMSAVALHYAADVDGARQLESTVQSASAEAMSVAPLVEMVSAACLSQRNVAGLRVDVVALDEGVLLVGMRPR